MSLGNFSSLVLDLGGVLLLYSANNVKTLTPRQISNALDSPIWHEYERGKVSKEFCYEAICRDFDLDSNAWAEALDAMRESLRPNKELIEEIKKLKLNNSELKVFGLSNIPVDDFQDLKALIKEWGIFDGFYASGLTGFRKPDIACYESFLEDCKIPSEACIFVDDRIENVVAAQSLGFRSVHFSDVSSVVATLNSLFGDPVVRGFEFLKRNATNLFCETNTGEIKRDNYSQLIILEHTGDSGQIDKLPNVYQYLCRLLKTEAYLLGTRYYENPDWFLFLLSDVCGKRPDDEALNEMRRLVSSQIQDRLGCDRNIFGAALRSLAAQALGIVNKKDIKTLLETQLLDGGWEKQWLWKYGKEAVKLGSRGVVTAMAVRAIEKAREDA
ncbi:hypothetical protein Neosp_012643 [[Neocosmospora] mangrovei]